ncbi:MAG: 3-hydroxyacyl-ACP dehydratase FabZ [Fusobacteriaceae bacterium]|jgi:3-hydroxyacyl-[acyl-carrier-protein] dehydratase|nr:3-hydroxyacyl-ACP dehydratase FabZ [Fusobacteriaceae bacterium]
MLDIVEIMKRIPHRYPFLLVDRILEMDKETKTVRGIKNVTMNEAHFEGHFPGHPIMPGVMIIESMAQCLGVLVMDDIEGGTKLPYFAGIDSAKFKRPVRPGDQLVYEVRVEKQKLSIVKAHGIAKVDGELACEATFTFSLVGK